MSLLRRWFDPVRSRWFFSRRYKQRHLSIDDGVSFHLRFDDAYSYLAVQQLVQLQDLLVEPLQPIKIIMSDQIGVPPHEMSVDQWLSYASHDAAVLAKQHGFTFDPDAPQPSADLIDQACNILQSSPLTGHDYLHLLVDVFHMLWQNQRGKLKTLNQMATLRIFEEGKPNVAHPVLFSSEPVSSAYIRFGGKRYRAIDDFLRFTRRLKRQGLLTAEPIFMINHIEWGEHLTRDPESLAEIQSQHAELDVFLALEDPISWLILEYIKRELVDFYNIQLTVYPLPYQGRDLFDWGLINRLSKRAEVPMAPFCRPSLPATQLMASVLQACDAEHRTELLLDLLQQCWCEGMDPEYLPHWQRMLAHYPQLAGQLHRPEAAAQWLQENQQRNDAYHQPDIPVFVLRVDGQTHVFNSLYRVWQIESLLSGALGAEEEELD